MLYVTQINLIDNLPQIFIAEPLGNMTFRCGIRSELVYRFTLYRVMLILERNSVLLVNIGNL